jgi:hypothetical protein
MINFSVYSVLFSIIGEKTKYDKIYELFERMGSLMKKNRPNCDKLLEEKHLWSIEFNFIRNDPVFDLLRNQSDAQSIDDCFYSYFIRMKSQIFSINKM